MRLSTDQIQAIRQAATASFGEGVAVWLFGSRVDDNKKGGDIDLLVRPPPAATGQPFAKKIKMLGQLERLLGDPTKAKTELGWAGLGARDHGAADVRRDGGGRPATGTPACAS